ncbi:BamA/TamA family outer membrane protein [Parahaliea mediterranea]|uniref:BamA/TamA family outer membrane protein n=1 Tax=Parahaliea mediterranea TaxID=651086 RepID=UPI00130065E4|nr:BamA/TamA family outer membrane protein [Parahaliea mediterranea]
MVQGAGGWPLGWCWGAALAALLLCALPAMAQQSAGEQCVTVAEQDYSDAFRFQPSAAHDDLVARLPANVRIRSIRYQRFSVFNMEDPEENSTLYRWANELHSITREWVLEDQMLLREGDVFEPRRAEESERILRNLRFIYDARVRPWRWCGDVVDVEVLTRDIWTFTPSLSLSRSGGENAYAIGFRDANFLGTGKQVLVEYDSDEERAGYTLLYADPALFGSRWQMRARYTDNDDGYDHGLRLEKPFFSVYEPWSAGTSLDSQKLEEKLWFRGDEVSEFDHEREQYRVYGGLAADVQVDQRVNRWLLGYNYEAHSFGFSDSDIPPAQLPEDRDYSYPYIGFQSVEDKFAELHNFDYLGRTEDVFVGERYTWTLGYSAEGLGATRDQLAFSGGYSNTLLADDRQFWVVGSQLSGFFGVSDQELENFWWEVETRYQYKQSERWALFSGLRLDYTDGLTDDNQLTLGGSNGLRGYDLHYQVGDRSFVWNIEQRYYSDWHPFRLLRVGFAAFVDVGRAWYENRDNGSNGGVLANAGFGIRLNSSRAEKGSVIHIDFAFPFVRDDDVDDVQVLFTVKERF